MDKFLKLKEKMDRRYDRLPAMDGEKCSKACQSGKCKFECCTITGCTEKEKRLINKFIARNGLEFPLIKATLEMNYILPNNLNIESMSVDEFTKLALKKKWDVKCSYLTEKGCGIYEVRPAICRMFGAIKQMSCPHFPEEAKEDMPANEIMVNF